MSVLAAGGTAAGVGVLATPSAASADTVVYSNLANSSGFFYPTGTPSTSTDKSGDYTPLGADDVAPITGFAGRNVSSFTFSIVNANNDAATPAVGCAIRFYDSNATNSSGGATGLPGTLLAAYNFDVQIPAQEGGTVPITLDTSGDANTDTFTLPSSGFIWAGVSFFNDNGVSTSVTDAELANVGQELIGPPTIGTSQDVFFQSTDTGPYLTNTPNGQLFNFGNATNPANPLGDFGFAISVANAAPVPEPASVGVLALAGGAILGRRRRRLA